MVLRHLQIQGLLDAVDDFVKNCVLLRFNRLAFPNVDTLVVCLLPSQPRIIVVGAVPQTLVLYGDELDLERLTENLDLGWLNEVSPRPAA